MTSREILEYFSVKVFNDALGMEISVCGLCGNSGIIDTRCSAKWDGKNVGILDFCLCPNGRAMNRKDRATKRKTNKI